MAWRIFPRHGARALMDLRSENNFATLPRTNRQRKRKEQLKPGTTFEKPQRRELTGMARYGIALALCVASVLSRFALDQWLGDAQHLITLYGAVALAVWLGGWRAGVVTSVVGFLALAYFFIPPRNALALNGRMIGSAVGCWISCGIIIAFAEIAQRARRVAIEQRRQREEALESLNDGFFVYDLDFRPLYINRAGLNITRRTWEELKGRVIWELFPDARALNEPHWKRALAEKKPAVFEIYYPPFDTWYEQRVFPGDDTLTVIATDVTARKRSQDARSRLAAIVESSTDAIISADLNGAITSWNRGAELLYGYSAAEALGKSVEIILPPDQVHEERRILDRIRKGETVASYETSRRKRDGCVVPVSLTASPIRDENGAVIGISKNARDITARKQAEEALRAGEERQRLVMDNAPALISYVDQNLVYRFGNARYLDWFDRRDIAGLHVRDVLGDEVYRHREPHIRAALKGVASHFEAITVHHLLGPRHTEVVYLPDRAPDGKVRGCYVFVTDIHERTIAEHALREGESRFRQLADAMPQLLWTANSDGSVDYYNERISSYAGATRGDDGLWRWESLIHPDDREMTQKEWDRAVADERLYTITHRIAMADGSYRWHLTRARPVRDAGGTVVKWFGTATDIDDQKRSEERLELMVEQRTAKLSETVADLEAFSYSIAHDMRAPLRSMSGYASLLRSENGEQLDEQGREFIRRIIASAERMDRLIQDVLNYSKVVRGELTLEPVALDALAKDIIQTYQHLQEPNATIQFEGSFPTVRANPAALTQVISNLLGNAVKFVAKGTKPRVVIRCEDAGGKFVRIWFEDNGIGIARESQQRIFQIFQRLHRPELYEGTGIGLSIVRKAVERMGGRVGVESAPGAGSRFWVELEKCQ